MTKRKEIAYPKQTNNISQDLPSLSSIKNCEKLVASISCKIYPSLAEWIKRKGGSEFLRKLIEQAKKREEQLREIEVLINS